MSDRATKLAALAAQLNREAAKKNPDRTEPVVFLASERMDLLHLGLIPTGNPTVDRLVGGGLPRGTIAMLVGPPGTGKSCLAWDTIAYNQKVDPGFYAAFVHLESRAFPKEVAEQAGVDFSRLIVINAQQSGEKTLDLVMELLFDFDGMNAKDLVDLVVIDSVAAAAPEDEIKAVREEGFAKHTVGRQAAMLSKMLRDISGCGCLGRACLLLINQIRVDVGGYGAPETSPGGKSVQHYPKIIVRMGRPGAGLIKEKDVVLGHTVSIKITKNNTGRGKPFAEGSYEVIYGKGVDRIGPLVDLAVEHGVIEQTSASWFRLRRDGHEAKVNGREKLKDLLRDDPELIAWIEAQIYPKGGNSVASGEA